MLPTMRREGLRAIRFPELSGGLCETSDSLLNNQMQVCDNMIYMDGALRHRPGFHRSGFDALTTYRMTDGFETTISRLHVTPRNRGWVTWRKLHQNKKQPIQEEKITYNEFDQDGNSTFSGGTGTFYRISPPIVQDGFFTVIGSDADGNCTIEKYFGGAMSIKQPYIPTVSVGCKTTEDRSRKDADYAVQDLNALTGSYKMEYTKLPGKLYYPLLTAGRPYALQATVSMIDSGNIYTPTVGATADSSAEFGPSRITLHIDRVVGCFWFEAPGAPGVPHDLKATVKAEVVDFELPEHDGSPDISPTKMQHTVWFGGDRSGRGKGTRLFMAGDEDQKNLLIWSALNNPEYWPIHNYAFIGDADEKITGFGRIGAALVVFKEHSIYLVDYNNANYSFDTFYENALVGAPTANAIFPVTPLHDSIGCSHPETVALCDNRLVWFDKGEVYMLANLNQYNENNVVKLSGNIRLPKQYGGTPCAAEYRGHYVLSVGEQMFVMNYGSTGFQAYNSYNSAEKAQDRVQWFRWIPNFGNAFRPIDPVLFNDGEKLRAVLTKLDRNAPLQNTWIEYMKGFQLIGGADTQVDYDGLTFQETLKPISCRILSKSYDFGDKSRYKTLHKFVIGVEGKAALSYARNGGEEKSLPTSIDEPELKQRRVRVPVSRVRTLAIGVVGENLVLDGLELYFNLIGDVK